MEQNYSLKQFESNKRYKNVYKMNVDESETIITNTDDNLIEDYYNDGNKQKRIECFILKILKKYLFTFIKKNNVD